MPNRKNITTMTRDAAVIAQLGRKVVFLECRNQELEEKVKNLEELLDQALNVKKGESDDEEPLIEAVVRPWPASQNEARGCLPHTGARSRSHPAGALQNNSTTTTNPAAASAANTPAVTSPTASPADSVPPTSVASSSGNNSTIPSIFLEVAAVIDQYFASTSNSLAVTSTITSPALSVPSTSVASSSGSVLTSPSTTYSTAHANASWSSASGTHRSDQSEALYEAAEAGDAEKVRKLLREGANVNYGEADSGMMPLHAAACGGHTKVVALLIDFGAELDVFDEDGDTPLHLAASHGFRFCVDKLTEAGAHINVRGLDGNTPLHLAADFGTYGCVRALLNAGADLYAKNILGKIPSNLAHTDSVRKLFMSMMR